MLLVDQKALTFGGSDPNNTIRNLLKAPITNIDAVLGGAAELNKKGAGLCRDISQLTNKYPFSLKAKSEASLPDIDFVFQPARNATENLILESLVCVPRRRIPHAGPWPGCKVTGIAEAASSELAASEMAFRCDSFPTSRPASMRPTLISVGNRSGSMRSVPALG